jgi:hypothetical protein
MIKAAFSYYLELVGDGWNRESAKAIAREYLDCLRWDAAQRPSKLDIMNWGGQI